MAAENGQIELLHTLWEWAKEILTLDELNNIFLGKNKYERTAWHMALEKGQVELLHKLWEWENEVLMLEE